MGFFFKGISWFIEADVSVPADTKQLHIHTSGLPDDFVILCRVPYRYPLPVRQAQRSVLCQYLHGQRDYDP